MSRKQKNIETETLRPLFRFFLLVIVVIGIIFFFYGMIQSNFGYPPVEEIPEHLYQMGQSGTTTGVPGISSEKAAALAQEWILPLEVTQPSQFINDLEKLIFEKTNEERKQRNNPSLNWEEGLARTARYHSNDMGKNDFFDHQNLQDMGASLRAAKIHRRYVIGVLGENIFMITKGTNTCEVLAEKIMRGWMNSTGHRANILKPEYNSLGVGSSEIMKNGETMIYATQVFGKTVGYLDKEFPHTLRPSQALSIRLKVMDTEYLAASSVLIVNIHNRGVEAQFDLTDNGNLESSGSLKTPLGEGVYHLQFHIPYQRTPNAYRIFRGPIFSIKKEN